MPAPSATPQQQSQSSTYGVISGTIVDEQGQPLIGVSVQIVRQQGGYITDVNGTAQSVAFDPFSLMMLVVGGSILLFPIVTFVAVATQLGGAQREKRYAALRLVGAT